MSTIDTSTWNPDADLNTAIEGIPLNSDAGIAQTWQALRVLMAAVKGDGDAIKAMIDVMQGATASADGASGLVPQPLAGDQDKVLKGDGTWGNAPFPALGTASRAVQTDANGALAVSSVTTTELGCLSGVASSIQTQLDGKADVEDVSSTFTWETEETPAHFFAYRVGKFVSIFYQGAAKTHSNGNLLGTTTLTVSNQTFVTFVKNTNAYGTVIVKPETGGSSSIKVNAISSSSASGRIYFNGSMLLA